MNKIKISFELESDIIPKKPIVKYCKAVLKKLAIKNWEISVFFCSDQYIAQLNDKFRKKSGPTDVLTFSQNGFVEKKIKRMYYAGDIVISRKSLLSNCQEFNVSEEDELKRLLVHGALHLTGRDHKTNDLNEEMIILQEKILAEIRGVIKI